MTMTLEQIADDLRKCATGKLPEHAVARACGLLADAIDARLTHTTQVDVERLLAALGHVRVSNSRCHARVAETPPQLQPPGPHNPPMWCCLPVGHDWRHRHNGGGMYPSIPFRDTDSVVMGDSLPDRCGKCRAIWPCPDVQAITAALSAQPTQSADLAELLKDPVNVQVMMLRGAIAIPSIRSMVHLRGEVPNGEDIQLARIAELQEQLAALEAQPAQSVDVEKVREVISEMQSGLQLPGENLSIIYVREWADKLTTALTEKLNG